MRQILSTVLVILSAGLAFAGPATQPLGGYAGSFSDGNLTVELASAGGGYAGTISLGQQKFPATAHLSNGSLEGSFQVDQHSFPFTANLQSDTLTLVSGSKTYAAKRVVSAVNPLDAPAIPADVAAPAGYSTINHTAAGEFFSAQKSDVKSVREALTATFRELEKYFDGRPEVGSAYEDTRDHNAGEAVFKASLKGKAVKGVVSCKISGTTAMLAVMYIRADSSAQEWNALATSPAPAGAKDDADDKLTTAAMSPAIPLKPMEFPDGTGSIGLADGWTTKSSSLANAVVITGPAGQLVLLNSRLIILTPDSAEVATVRHNADMMRRMGGNPPPQAPMLVAPYLEPLDAIKTIFPQFSAMSQFNGGPTSKLDEIVSVKDAPPGPGGKSAAIVFKWTQFKNGRPQSLRSWLWLSTSKVDNTHWMMFASRFNSPEATYDQDAPVMFAMMNSQKMNADRTGKVMNEQAQQQTAAALKAGEEAHDALMKAHADNMRDQEHKAAERNTRFEDDQQKKSEGVAKFEAGQLQKSRHNADFNEMILGSRDVLDTRTGEKAAVDYYNVDAIVDGLNAINPGRFKQIPLRDELYPLPH